ncbi:Compactin diketide synthase mokB [Penicillium rolfsii]|nr:Compactin diketide synthase mokB [Penicillium rolfsii]
MILADVIIHSHSHSHLHFVGNNWTIMGGHSNGSNGSTNTLGRANGNTSMNGDDSLNGLNANGHNGSTSTSNGTGNHYKPPTSPSTPAPTFQPVAIGGMACRLPEDIHSPSELWSFLHAGRDARGPVPSSRYNISAFHLPHKRPGAVIAQQGYFLNSTNDLVALDTSFFSMPRREVEALDPQQRLLLEVAREAIDDAGETRWRGTNVLGQNDFIVSNRLSHELDLHGPSSITRGDYTSAIVSGTNIIIALAFTAAKSEKGFLSPDSLCNTFSPNANGYARGEGIVAIYFKHPADAVRDGNPVRVVVTGSAANHNGHTPTVSYPSSQAQEALIRQAYRNASIAEIARTGFFECHGTGTRTGDPIKVAAVSACFGKAGVHISLFKANLDHAEDAAGLVTVLKAVLALENRIIPPNIKCFPRNPAIPFEDANLVIPAEPTPWPEDRGERVSINSFGLGGSNAHAIIHAIIESAASFIDSPKSTRAASNTPHLLLFSPNTPASLKTIGEKYKAFLKRSPDLLSDIAYTLANKREHLPYRIYAVCTSDKITLPAPPPSIKAPPSRATSLVIVFTRQGAQ